MSYGIIYSSLSNKGPSYAAMYWQTLVVISQGCSEVRCSNNCVTALVIVKAITDTSYWDNWQDDIQYNDTRHNDIPPLSINDFQHK
jgi:hypothetical protein